MLLSGTSVNSAGRPRSCRATPTSCAARYEMRLYSDLRRSYDGSGGLMALVVSDQDGRPAASGRAVHVK